MRTPISDLLEALERHTQAVQANTAAVNSLLGRKVGKGIMLDQETRAAITGQLDALGVQLRDQLEGLAVFTDRLALLRHSLTIDLPPDREETHESTGPNTAG